MERKGLSQTPRFTKEEQKDGMIRESSTRSSSLETKFYYLIQE
jgi:hypothetical protein